MISQESVVEIKPEFDEVPSNWLRTFDQYNNVQDQYSISLADGGLMRCSNVNQLSSPIFLGYGAWFDSPSQQAQKSQSQRINNPFGIW